MPGLSSWIEQWRLRRQVRKVLKNIPADFGGGCGIPKATIMAGLIRDLQLRVTVDIGVYYGRSFFPQAIAHQLNTDGVVYGVDPYELEYARNNDLVGDLRLQSDEFMKVLNLEAVYKTVVERIDNLALQKHAILLRLPSSEAINYFKNEGIMCDMVHIDGNHDTENVLSDVNNYISQLTPNGILVMDDTHWDTLRPALQLASSQLGCLYEKPKDGWAILCRPDTVGAEYLTREILPRRGWVFQSF